MQRVAIMNLRIFDFHVSGGIGKQNTPVWFRRRDVNIVKIRAALCVKVNPQFQTFNLQIFQIDIAAQIQGVKILDAHRSQQAINLAKFLAGKGIVEIQTK